MRRIKQLFQVALALLLIGGVLPAQAQQARPERDAVLIFHHVTGYRHDSIPTAVAAVDALVRAQGLTPVASDDPATFDGPLDRFAAIVLVSTTTDPERPDSEWFTGQRREALQALVRRGGGIVALHAAADSHYQWPWYTRLIGGKFARHPAGTPEADLARTDSVHPATARLPERFRIADEWYWFADRSPAVDLLLTLDPQSIGEPGDAPAPVAWAHEFEGGRIFYTGLGHRSESWSDQRVLDHVAGGLAWALGRENAPAVTPPPAP